LRPVALAARDAEQERRARDLETGYPPDAAHPAQQVMRDGTPLLLRDIPDALLVGLARDARHLELLRGAGPGSVMIVPMLAHGEALGAIALVGGEDRPRYGPADLAFAERLADRAASALDNARLYAEAQRRATQEEALR